MALSKEQLEEYMGVLGMNQAGTLDYQSAIDAADAANFADQEAIARAKAMGPPAPPREVQAQENVETVPGVEQLVGADGPLSGVAPSQPSTMDYPGIMSEKEDAPYVLNNITQPAIVENIPSLEQERARSVGPQQPSPQPYASGFRAATPTENWPEMSEGLDIGAEQKSMWPEFRGMAAAQKDSVEDVVPSSSKGTGPTGPQQTERQAIDAQKDFYFKQVQSAAQAVDAAGRMDYDRWWNKMNVLGKALTGVGLAAGGIADALAYKRTGVPPKVTTMDRLMDIINYDLQQQKQDYETKKGAYNTATNLYALYRQAGLDADAAENAARDRTIKEAALRLDNDRLKQGIKHDEAMLGFEKQKVAIAAAESQRRIEDAAEAYAIRQREQERKDKGEARRAAESAARMDALYVNTYGKNVDALAAKMNAADIMNDEWKWVHDAEKDTVVNAMVRDIGSRIIYNTSRGKTYKDQIQIKAMGQAGPLAKAGISNEERAVISKAVPNEGDRYFQGVLKLANLKKGYLQESINFINALPPAAYQSAISRRPEMALPMLKGQLAEVNAILAKAPE